MAGMSDDPIARSIETQVRLARAAVENLRPADLAAELASGDMVLVDVREPDELSHGTIAGAMNVPRGVIEFAADPRRPARRTDLDPRRRVVVFSETGSRSALVVHALYRLGYRDVAHLEGGLAAWVADGRPVVARSVIG